jgi:hypothetical protein
MRVPGLQGREGWIATLGTLAVATSEWTMARKVAFCGTPDSCAYLALGQSLSRHQGFRENFLFQYQFVGTHLPTHGIEYWRPGVSFLLLLAQPFGGVTLHSSLFVTMLAGICLALAAWRIAIDYSRDRRIACASYLLCLVLPPVWNGGLSPDSALYYGAFAAWFLALLRVDFRSYWEDCGALLCVAGVSLIRNDAILLLVPLLAVLWMRRRRNLSRGASLGYVAMMLAGFVAANAPMPLIDYAVLGNAFPPGTGGALYLNDLSDLSAYGPPVTLHTMLAHGIGALVKLRVAVLPQIVYRLVWLVVGFGAIFVPILAMRRGAGERPALPELTGGLSFLFTVVAVYGLVLPAVGQFSALRSFMGLLPLIAVLMVAGMVALGGSPGVRRTLFGGAFVFYLLAGLMANRRGMATMAKDVTRLHSIALALEGEGIRPGSGAVVMVPDSAQFSETTGYPAIPLPANGWAGLKAAVADLKPARVVMSEARYQELRAQLGSVPAERVDGADAVILNMGSTAASTP